MKALLIGLSILLNLSFTVSNSNRNHQINGLSAVTQINKRDAVVYICNGPNSYAYHSHGRCSGLNNCSTQIYAISLSEALGKGRRACQKCY
jgi:hypothetical protein